MSQIIEQATLREFISEELDNDAEMVERLFSIFKEYISEFHQIGFDGSDENMEQIRMQSHKLKASCSSFGACPLRDALSELEQSAREKKVDTVQTDYPKAVELSKQTLSVLEDELKSKLEEVYKSA